MKNDFNDIDDETAIPNSIKEGRGINECIHIFKESDKIYSRIGTGFLINNHGVFLTAAHNFKEDSSNYFAVYNSEKYEIVNIFSEYTIPDEYKFNDNICKDLLIGRLEGFKPPINFMPGNLSYEKVIHNELIAEGYNTKLDAPFIEVIYKDVKFYYKTIYNNYVIPQEVLLTDKRANMGNVDPFYIKNFHRISGLSGGPVYKCNKIFGMFIGNFFITSSYILDKLKELNVI